jgi:hypothetical protein
MTQTNCNKCIFSQPVSEEPNCYFDIPNQIKQHKEIIVNNNYNIINNYNCLYGFSKNQYNANIQDLESIEISELVRKKANLKYYLLIDAREAKDSELPSIIDDINNSNIKPKKLSIIIDPNRSENFYQLLRKNISCEKWTIHVYINSISFNDCINIILDTNLSTCDSWCVLFYDGSKRQNNNPTLNLTNITDYLHQKIIIQQSTNLGFINDDSLHGLCLNCGLYKYLTSVVSNNILNGIKIMKDINLQPYEIY